MRRTDCIGIVTIVALVTIVATATSRSQTADSDATTPAQEPITGSASTPLSGDELHPKAAFQPYSIGDPPSAWSYQTLNAEEKTVVDHGAAEDFTAVNSAYAADSKALAERAKAEAAASQLGADNLGTIGVVQ